MSHTLSARDEDAVELMDDPAADPEMLARTYARFGTVNAIVSGQRDVYEDWVRPRLSRTSLTRVLDIGTGGADLPLRMLRWASREGVRLEVVAIDPDPRAVAFARSVSVSGLVVRAASSADLADAGERFDVVHSNHVLHHLDGHAFGALLADSERLVAPGGVAVHGDIARSRWGYAGFAAATWPFERNLLKGTFIRADGLTSIRRSFTAPELAAVLPPGWRARRAFPSRLEAVWSPGGDR
ncbi:methyltransferase domain-containing protein [Agromyces protaetiae]|uniref:Methyltransferase domain-containing protein n=1 Tax=Agromyces protaetiae TaxID=2509455 RepID=A0A4V0YGX6_9MICO|nr:methyltransferase domain-containing protein [Agromyces protaetiae]QAY72741.1 methyltransferase domain-containing protein [Agromyces protaetiae]